MLPVGDYLLVTRAGHTLGAEEKKSDDLWSSRSTRRFQRQLSQLREAVDIPVLGLRCTNGMVRDSYFVEEWVVGREHLSLELLKWGAFGGVMLLPADPAAVVKVLLGLREFATPGRHLYSVLAGDDRGPVHKKGTFEEAMCNLFKGMGPKRAAQLRKYFSGNFARAINAGPRSWEDAGMPKNVVEAYTKLVSF